MMCQLYICTVLSLSFLVTRPPARGKDLLISLLKCLVFSVSLSKFLFFQYNISKIIIIHFNIIFSDSPNHIAVANSKIKIPRYHVVKIFELTLTLILMNLKSKACESNKLSCDEGEKCLPLTWVCDNISDCNDNKDEHNCPNKRTGNE